jgi:hypothetical protein
LAGEAGERATATHYSHLYSRMLLVMLAGEAIGTSAGGAMGSALAALPFLAQSALMLVAIIPLLALPEQRVATHHRGQPLAHVGAGLRAVRRDPALLCLLLLSGLLAGVFSTVSMYSQLFFSALGLSQAAIGLLFAVAIVPNALYAGFSPRLIARLPAVWLLGTCIVAEAMGLLAMRTAWLPLALPGFVLLFYATDALVMPAISRYLNERAPEAQRSVVLSLDTGLFSAVMIVLFPLFGFGLTHGSFTGILTWTLLALVGGGGAIGLTARWLLSRRGNARGAVNDTAGMTSQ